jgi:hypothetical protein
MDKEILVEFERDTKRMYRYKTPAADGDRQQTFYFPKEWFGNTPPKNLTIVVKIPE